jgi:myo-inositol-1(or 4)-monophosphatase
MNDLEEAIAVAEEGAAVVRRRFGTTLQRLDKGVGDFATNADIEAEKAMLAVLHRERPEDVIIEFGKKTPDLRAPNIHCSGCGSQSAKIGPEIWLR